MNTAGTPNDVGPCIDYEFDAPADVPLLFTLWNKLKSEFCNRTALLPAHAFPYTMFLIHAFPPVLSSS
jgi:hypothetical protein